MCDQDVNILYVVNYNQWRHIHGTEIVACYHWNVVKKENKSNKKFWDVSKMVVCDIEDGMEIYELELELTAYWWGKKQFGKQRASN